MKNALILSGGGARAAYQVGVLKAVAEVLPETERSPFPIICGTSAGAINALALAAHGGSFREAVADLERTWKGLDLSHVYKHGWLDLGRGVSKLGFSLFNEGIGRDRPLSFLDNSPLRDTLTKAINFDNIDKSIGAGKIDAVSVTAMGYTSGESVSFFQGRPDLNAWRRYRRVGRPERLSVEHLLASSAIPTIFPTVRIGAEYYGDGALRQLAPISPALHLGADRVFVVGVSSNRNPRHWGSRRIITKHSPSMGQILGHLFNSAFVDSLESDIERLERINELLTLVPEDVLAASDSPLRPVDSLVISPSRELDKIAGRNIRYLPKSMRFFLRSTGSTAHGGGATAASYLMFQRSFCDELINLGYQDTMWEVESIKQFFAMPTPSLEAV
jgi:NTE family protein